MTAEIAVLNKSAVALAADSAVTIGRGASSKIYNSVNKIFELSECAPVGMMIYGRLDFMGLPLETLIKQYRNELGSSTFPKIIDYKIHFKNWLESNVPSSKLDEDQIVMLICLDIFEKINKELEVEILNEIRVRSKYLRSKDNGIATRIAKSKLANIRKIQKMSYADKSYIANIESSFGPVIDNIITGVVNQINPNQQTKDLFHKVVIESITRKDLSSFRTGVVIAGFGDEERCPSLERFEMDGVISGHLKATDGPGVDIGRSGPHAEALGFAQSDMIERFMHGIDPEMHKYASGLIKKSIEETATEIVSAMSGGAVGTLPSAVTAVIDQISQKQIENLEKYKENEYTKQIKDMIRHMPKQEISGLARALIELTSLKRKVSREQETVGGEVDVAIISKSEGFVWVNRKHYFPPDINPRFFARHYKN